MIMKKMLYLMVVVLMFSCEEETLFPIDPVNPNTQGPAQSDDISDSVTIHGDASLGLSIYRNSLDMDGRACINCHLSPTGIDIAQFGMANQKSQDSIIVHRGMQHISKEETYHIAAYIRQLTQSENVTPNNNGSLGSMIGLDNSNGVPPSQVWDGSTPLTVSIINSWDFRTGITHSFEIPRWFKGDETNELYDDNLDWLPEVDLITEKGGQVELAYDTYLSNPNKENLLHVLQQSHYSLSEGERHPGEHDFYDFDKSLDYQKWMATLYMQHLLKPNSDLSFGEELTGYNVKEYSISESLWDAGNVARRSEDNATSSSGQIKNRLTNEVQWLYLGWLTNYGKKNSFETQYIGTALKDYGERDLASLVILKSLVSRSSNTQRVYDDVNTMSHTTSDDMLYESLKFGVTYLLDGLENDYDKFKLVTEGSIYWATYYWENNLVNTITNSPVLTQTEKTEILGMVDSVINYLKNM